MAVNDVEIAVGQKWLTCNGEEVCIVSKSADKAYPWDLSNGFCVTDTGLVYEFGASKHDLCILVQDEHGFIPWNGGECPVPNHTEIKAKLRCGDLEQEVAEWFDWSVTGVQGDIVAYRVVKNEKQPKQKKESTVETMIETTEEPKYTVDQVFKAINEATDDLVMYTNVSKVKAHLAKAQDPDYKLYLILKARFE